MLIHLNKTIFTVEEYKEYHAKKYPAMQDES